MIVALKEELTNVKTAADEAKEVCNEINKQTKKQFSNLPNTLLICIYCHIISHSNEIITNCIETNVI